MKLKFAAAVAALAFSTGAFAVGPGALGALDNVSIDIGHTFGASFANSTFSDNYTFSILNPGDVGGVVSSKVMSKTGIINLKASLLGGSLANALLDTNAADGFDFLGLSAGSYTLTITGKVIGVNGGSYGGTVAADTAPVPEPESLALALAGLSIAGLLARRRRQG